MNEIVKLFYKFCKIVFSQICNGLWAESVHKESKGLNKVILNHLMLALAHANVCQFEVGGQKDNLRFLLRYSEW